MHAFYQKIKRAAFPITLALIFLFVLSLLVWLSIAKDFEFDYIRGVGLVPWFFYAAKLGIKGILAIIGLYYFLSNHKKYSKLEFFIFMALIVPIGGKIMSYINMKFFTGLAEERFLYFAAPAFAVPAALGLVKLLQPIKRVKDVRGQTKKILGASVVALIVGSVVVWGTSCTLLSIDYWNYVAKNYEISSDELEAVNFMDNVFQKNPHSVALAITRLSYNVLSLSAPSIRFDPLETWGIETSMNPVFSTYMLSTSGKEWTTIPYSMINHAYLYLHNRDLQYLNENSYLVQHILPNLSPIFNNSEAKVYEIPYRSHPLLDSDTALVTPFTQPQLLKNYYYAFDALALEPYSYTMLYDLDHRVTNKKTLILSFDPPEHENWALSFDGEDDYVDCGNDRSLNVEFPFTLECWMKTGQTTPAGGWICKMMSYKTGYWLLLYSPTGAVQFAFGDGTNWYQGRAGLVNDGLWHHVVGVATSNRAYIYLDGKLVLDEPHSVTGILANDQPLVLGRHTTVPDEGDYEGFLDEVRIYNRSLSASEVIDRYENDKDIRDGLVAEYGFNEGSGNVACDSGPNANDGVLHGADWVQTVVLRDPQDYMEYVRSGGKLIVLNTNGYGFFSDFLLGRTNITMLASKITGGEEISIPDVQVSVTHPKEGVEVTSYYVAPYGEKMPLAVSRTVENGEIIYVDIFPLIRTLTENRTVGRVIYLLLGRVLETSGIRLEESLHKESQNLDIQGYFKGANLKGNISISTSSIIFPPSLDSSSNITVYREGLTISNITSLTLDNYTKAVITLEDAEIDHGMGPYTMVTVKGTVKLEFYGENCSLSVKTHESKEEIRLRGLNEIRLFTVRPLSICIHSPLIRVKGECLFDQISGAVGSGRSTEDNLNVSGTTEFRIFYSDIHFFLAGSYLLEGTLNYGTPITNWSEWNTIPWLVIWSLVLLPILIAAAVLTKVHTGSARDFTKE